MISRSYAIGELMTRVEVKLFLVWIFILIKLLKICVIQRRIGDPDTILFVSLIRGRSAFPRYYHQF